MGVKGFKRSTFAGGQAASYPTDAGASGGPKVVPPWQQPQPGQPSPYQGPHGKICSQPLLYCISGKLQVLTFFGGIKKKMKISESMNYAFKYFYCSHVVQ